MSRPPAVVLLFLVALLVPSLPAWGQNRAPRKTVGVALLPHAGESRDGSEQTLHRLMGDIPFVDHVHAVATPVDLLRILNRYAKGGRRIDPLILGGHGPEPGNDSPGILLGRLRLEPWHVDRKFLTETLARKVEELGRLERAERANRAANLGHRISALITEVRERRRYLAELETVSGALAPGATIWLFNCNALQGPNGIRFATLLGQSFFGRRGGQVIGSRINVGLGNGITRFVADMRNKPWRVSGEWRRIPFEPVFSWPVEPGHAWNRLSREQWRDKTIWFRTRSARGELQVYRTGGAYAIARSGSKLEYFDHTLFLHYHRLVDSGPVPDDAKVLGYEVWESVRNQSRWTFRFESR